MDKDDTRTAPASREIHDEIVQLNREMTYCMARHDLVRAMRIAERVKDLQATQVASGMNAYQAILVAQSLGNLACIYTDQRRLAEAKALYERTLELLRKAQPYDDPLVPIARHPLAMWLGNFGVFCADHGDPGAAVLHFEQALALPGSDAHPRGASLVSSDACLQASLLTNLGKSYQSLGRLRLARRYLLEARESYQRAAREYRERLARKDYGARRQRVQHPQFSEAAHGLALVSLRSGEVDEAFQYLREGAAIDDEMIPVICAESSDHERQAFLDGIRHHWSRALLLTLRFRLRDKGAETEAFDLLLRRKAIGWEASAAIALASRGVAAAMPLEEASNLNRLREECGVLARRAIAEPALDERRRALTRMHDQRERLEVALARAAAQRLSELVVPNQWRSVAAMLPAECVLVEIVRADAYGTGLPREEVDRYVAFVLTWDEPQAPLVIDLGEARQIDALCVAFRVALAGQGDQGARQGLYRDIDSAAGEPGALEAAGQGLRRATFDKLVGAFASRRRILVAADGKLAGVPFGALPMDRGGYLIDRFEINYLGTARDVLRFTPDKAESTTAPVVVADPAFDAMEHAPPAGDDEASRHGSGERVRCLREAGIRFAPLPGARTEGERIAALLGADLLMDAKASKSALRGLRSPRILHIATHGFFLPDLPEAAARAAALSGPGMEDPLLRSGLALAGANATLGTSSSAPHAAPHDDGILTADEVMGLSLTSTQMVVLSSCDSGLGDVRNGEGVFGLQRAFALAGVQSLVMSLWKVDDDATCRLMELFYGRLVAATPRGEALRAAQLELRASHPHPSSWAAFVLQGNPGPLP